MANEITHAEMIAELRAMLSPRIRSTAEVERRTVVFRAIIEVLSRLPSEVKQNA